MGLPENSGNHNRVLFCLLFGELREREGELRAAAADRTRPRSNEGSRRYSAASLLGLSGAFNSATSRVSSPECRSR
jgi:hypothetical protein